MTEKQETLTQRMSRVRESVGKSIQSRKLAMAVIEMIQSGEKEALDKDRYWEEIVSQLPKKFLPVVRDLPMTEQEATQFEATTVSWGRHKGTAVKDIPIDYLDWLDAQPDDRRQLSRYLRSDRVQRERR